MKEFATIWAVEATGVEVLRLDVNLDTVDVFGGVITVGAGGAAIGPPQQLRHHQTLYHIPSYAEAVKGGKFCIHRFIL